MSRIVVVGSNHAGTAAINTILGNYKGNEVVVYDRNSNISFLGCGMALWIGNQIRGSEGLFYASQGSLEKAGAKVHMQAEVQAVDFDEKKLRIRTTDGGEFEDSYDKLILATGSLPIIPDIPGMDLKNVQRVKLFQDAQAVIDKLKEPEIRNVVVVGAGYIGVELAEAFQRHGKEVTMIDIVDSCLCNYYDREFTDLMSDNLTRHGIRLAYGERVTELKGEGGRVASVVTDKNVYKADMVVMAIGFRPNTALGKDRLETFRNGAYRVDRHQRTSVPDVYAIGDCAVVYDNVLNDVNYIALATNAVRSGIVAAHNVCGTPLETIGVQGSNGISIYGLNMVSTGVTLEKARKLGFDARATDFTDKQKADFMEVDNPEVKIRIVYDAKSRVVLGAQMASRYDVSMGIHMFSLAIQEKVTIDRLKLLDIFFLPHFNKPYNYITMAALGAE
ncbi:MAG: FAD-dependent oxidoreductase [Fretibacterium sp.]|nr:FAD-dependent oxidoreductase [Fretibacterium sp.]